MAVVCEDNSRGTSENSVGAEIVLNLSGITRPPPPEVRATSRFEGGFWLIVMLSLIIPRSENVIRGKRMSMSARYD